jgi:hypothetical protein
MSTKKIIHRFVNAEFFAVRRINYLFCVFADCLLGDPNPTETGLKFCVLILANSDYCYVIQTQKVLGPQITPYNAYQLQIRQRPEYSRLNSGPEGT